MGGAAERHVRALGLPDIVILNDFEAQALAVVALGEEHMEKIGGGEPEPNAGRVVLGPGTGLGVAGLIHACGRWIPVPGEGGHMDIGPRTPRDFEVFPHIEPIEGRISGEQILCGRGLVNIYRAVAKADGKRAALHRCPPKSPRRRSTAPMRRPRKRWNCSSPALAGQPATWRWCSRAAAASSSPAASPKRSCRR